MDRVKRKKRKARVPKKLLLLSTVDPWDVRVASVEPESLAQRRGVSLSSIVADPESGSSPGSAARTPSPWYKPRGNSPLRQGSSSAEWEQSGALTSPEWPLPWYKPLRTPTPEPLRESTQSVPSAESRRDGAGGSLDDGIEANIEANIEAFARSNGRDSRIPAEKVTAVKFHFEHEKSPSIRSDGTESPDSAEKTPKSVPEIVVSDEAVGNGAGTGESNGRAVVPAGDKDSVESIVEDLVKARYSPQTARQRRLNRSSPRPASPDEGEGEARIFDDGEPSSSLSSSSSSSSENGSRKPAEIENREKSSTDLGVSRGENNPSNASTASMPDRLDAMDKLEHNIRQQGSGSRYRRHDSDSSATFSNSGSTPRESPLDSDTDDDVNEEEFARVPLQASPRRKTATIGAGIPAQKRDKESMEMPGVQSVNSTITSVNSISSLLKEKLQLSIPAALRNSKKQQNADYRIKAFVGVLFLTIVFLVGFAYVYYNQNVLQRAYFERFRFNKNDRVMHVYGKTGAKIVAARLGVGIPPETGVFSCLPRDERPDAVCLEWLDQTRLYLSHTQQADIHCYHVTWESLSPGYDPKDCFDWSQSRGHWYGAGQIRNAAYPLEKEAPVLEASAFVTGDVRKQPFGNVLKRYFLNSKGATVNVDPETPLYVSINANRSGELCIQAKYDSFAYVNRPSPLSRLNYTVCASDNVKTLHSSMSEKSLWDGLKTEDANAVTSLLSEPVWQISPTDEAVIYNYTEDVIALGFPQGHVLLSEEWQPNAGDFHLDENRFPSMEETINIIHRRGFKIVFTVQPFISTESANFREAVAGRLLISERGSDPRIPALTRYKQSNSAAILDVTNNRTLPWLREKLGNLVEKYHVDSFYLDLGNAYDMPRYYKCQRPLTSPDHYKSLFAESILSFAPVTGVSGAVARPRAPVFVSLPPFPSSWKAIKTVIPIILSYGIVGYPFVMPGAVGGDVALPMSDNNPDNDFEVNLPDKMLYVRWLQLSTFLPVIRFNHLPSEYSDESVLEMAKSLTTLRQKTVTPLLKKYAFEALDSGLPIIRPLWMLDPSDPDCHTVGDEFSVGEELIVAPILHSGSRQREVYLPAGVWRDGIDGSLRKGSRWIHNYIVNEDKVAYFVKMPDNTRF